MTRHFEYQAAGPCKMFITVLGVLDKFKSLWQAAAAFVCARNTPSAAILILDKINAVDRICER